MNSSQTSPPTGAPAGLVQARGQRAEQISALRHDHRQDMRRVLLISYQFPPTGGGGVQRAVKFAKYLPDSGWRPTILTVANPSVPVQDHDLERDLDPRTRIVRAKTWEPGYRVKTQLTDAGRRGKALRRLVRQIGMQVLQPDPQILWNPTAYRCAVRALSVQPHDAIVVTAPPFSSFLLGCKLKRRFQIPLILDFRDEWMLVGKYMENHQMGSWASYVQRAMMNRALRLADGVVATTRASAEELAECCRRARTAANVGCIYNGYDPDDFHTLAIRPQVSDRLRIVYTGTLWKLTDISPLVAGLEAVHARSEKLASRVELILAGRVTPEQDAVVRRLDRTAVSVTRHDYLPHGQALELAATADQLLLLLADEAGAERVVPAKMFEYMALQRPIMAILPAGETNDLLQCHPGVTRFGPADASEIARWLTARIAQRDTATPPMPLQLDADALRAFSRPSQTRQLAEMLAICQQR